MEKLTLQAVLMAIYATGSVAFEGTIMGVAPDPNTNEADVYFRIGGDQAGSSCIEFKVRGDVVERLPTPVVEPTPVVPTVTRAGNPDAGYEKPQPGYNAPVVGIVSAPVAEGEVAPAEAAPAEEPVTVETLTDEDQHSINISIRFDNVMKIMCANDIVPTGEQRENGEDVFSLVFVNDDGVENVVATGTLGELEVMASDKMNTPIDENAEIPSIEAEAAPLLTPEVLPEAVSVAESGDNSAATDGEPKAWV